MKELEKVLLFWACVWIVLLALSSLLGCGTPKPGCSKRETKKAARLYNRALDACEEEVARKGAQHYPGVTDSIYIEKWLKGETKIETDTLIQRFGDTVYLTRTVYATRVDTFEKASKTTEVNRAKERELELTIARMSEDSHAKDIKSAKQKKAMDIAVWSLSVLVSYCILRIILRLWLKINLP